MRQPVQVLYDTTDCHENPAWSFNSQCEPSSVFDLELDALFIVCASMVTVETGTVPNEESLSEVQIQVK